MPVPVTCSSLSDSGPCPAGRGEKTQARMKRMLVIGYGNPYRRDDGVALTVVNELRLLLDKPPLEEGMDGLEELACPTDRRGECDTLFLQQLTPELAELVAQYEEVIFVDAHVGEYADLLLEVVLNPTARQSIVSHHLHPEALLALTKALWGRAPQARLLSVRGSDFDFGTELSPRTQEGSQRATARIYEELASWMQVRPR